MAALGCEAPLQQGGVVFAPGAEARAVIAMRMGYLGFDREAVPGQVRRVVYKDQLPEGSGAGKIGDWVLENGPIVAVVTGLDGTARGGRLVDFARKPSMRDHLARVSPTVLGREVVYDSIVTGYDDSTAGSYVEVSGRVDLSSEGGPVVDVATRFDMGPGLELVVCHTNLKVVRGVVAPDAAPLLVERVRADAAATPVVDPSGAYGASLGDGAGYLVRPIGDVPTVQLIDGDPALVVPASAAPGAGEALVISRVITVLERADSAALAVALAQADGRDLGEIEVRVSPQKGKPSPRSVDLAFIPESGEPLALCDLRPTGEDSHYAARVPAGSYRIVAADASAEPVAADATAADASDAVTPRGELVAIEANRLAFVTLPPIRSGSRSFCGRVQAASPSAPSP
ncbi:MAG: hypothetical protein U0271_15550 [Polyangiaceae bacterium]